MASSEISVKDIGTVKVFRRRGLKNIRITIDHDGGLRLSLPWYVPKEAGVRYLITKKDWIKKHQKPQVEPWVDGARLTDDFELNLLSTDKKKIYGVKEPGMYKLFVPSDLEEPQRKQAIKDSLAEFLRAEAKKELPDRLLDLAKKHGYKVKDIKIRKLKSRWGSCSHQNVISLNILLVHLPRHLSDYVLIHELAHTKHLNHGKDFWKEVESKAPDYKERRKALRQFNPAGIL